MKTLTVKKPWGQFDQFSHNEESTVKIITVNPNSSLSLQTHKNRIEFWRVLKGHPIVTIGGNITLANPGDEFIIDKTVMHRLSTKDDVAQVLEIAYGDFDEEDITRIEDNYGRV